MVGHSSQMADTLVTPSSFDGYDVALMKKTMLVSVRHHSLEHWACLSLRQGEIEA